MATKTLGTNATTTLTAMQFTQNPVQADLATIQQSILDDLNVAHPIVPGAYTNCGDYLVIPNRGVLKILPGDWVGVDSRGWPILLSADTIANGPWTHT